MMRFPTVAGSQPVLSGVGSDRRRQRLILCRRLKQNDATQKVLNFCCLESYAGELMIQLYVKIIYITKMS
ncbi:hypothetical protein B2D07_03635 [Desulfococcus multivorans]|nr:uncharacterized protein Dmul_07580 [Desulfococcus multivorans]AQU99956.1 hypothetical protein B2D07_03635 [Desulfococcus multivorans]